MENNNELLKVLIDKVVDNGSAITAVQEQIRQLPDSGEAVEGLEKRMEGLERRLGMMGEALTKVIGMEGQVVAVGKDVREFREQLGAPGSRLSNLMSGLSLQLEEFVGFFSKPSHKEVHHRHFVGRAVWVLFGVALIAALEAGALGFAWHREAVYEQHDLLWRAAKVSDEPMMRVALDTLERRYEADAAQFGKDVVAEEERRMELADRLLQREQNQQRIQQLEQEKRKVGGK